MEFYWWIKARHVGVAAVTVESLVHADDASRVGHPSVPMLIAWTLQRMLRVVRFTLALGGLVFGHSLQRTKAKECLFAILRRRVSLRHNSEQFALSAAVGFPFGQLHLLDIALSQNEIKIRFKWENQFSEVRALQR